MTPDKIDAWIKRVGVAPDFVLQDHLVGPMGALLRIANPFADPPLRIPAYDPEQYSGQALVCLTYDDGLLDNYTRAAPLHLKYGIPANFAVIAKCLLRKRKHTRFMSPLMCRVLAELGFEISSHGMLHEKALRQMTQAERAQDVADSKVVIERAIGLPGAVTTYCIPFSRSRAGYVEYLHTVYNVVRHGGSAMNDMPLASNRCVLSYPLTNLTGFAEIKALIDDAIASRRTLVLLLHGIAEDGTEPEPFQVPACLLDQILAYIADQGPQRILPMRLSSLRQISDATLHSVRRKQSKNTVLHHLRSAWRAILPGARRG